MALDKSYTTIQDGVIPIFQLPYYRPPDQLPSPLPSTKTIHEGTVISSNRENFSDDHGHLAIVGNCFVVRYGQYITEKEGYALLLLEKYPSVPTPRLYAMYREDEILYLVMELLPGKNLLSVWDELSQAEKKSICSQLREAFHHIRSIPSPGFFGDVVGGPLPHGLFEWWLEHDPLINGPFQTIDEFHKGIARRSLKQQELNDQHPWSSEWFARHLPRVLNHHPSTFSHSDIVKQNIIVQEQPRSDSQVERCFKVTGIVDWEMAGWYPRYWEYAIYFADTLCRGEWEAMVETFIDPWPLEAALLRLVKVDMEGF